MEFTYWNNRVAVKYPNGMIFVVYDNEQLEKHLKQGAFICSTNQTIQKEAK